MTFGLGINLVMTVIGFAVSTMFIVFVCTRLICARIQLNATRRAYPAASRSDLGLLERGLHGLEPLVVANFPIKKFKFSDELFSSSGEGEAEGAQCTVCLAEYQLEEILRILPYCGHSFHVACIDVWLQQHSTCPVCRISLRDSPEKRRLMQPMFSSTVRSSSNVASQDSHPYHYFYTSHGYSSRSTSTRRMEPIQEDHFATDLDAIEVGENIASFNEGNHALKDTTFVESETKEAVEVESPSNRVP